MNKSHQERWEVIKELGQGGQGVVYRVRDKSKFDLSKIARGLKAPTPTSQESDQLPQINLFKEALTDLLRMDDPNTHGALKVLLPPDKAKDPERAEERLKREIEAMSKISHPNLLKILDFDLDEKWFVSQFYAKGSLNLSKPFIGDFVGALNAFRPLVEGVAKLHEEGMVHRDIKPHNVFIDTEGKLVLGDFGLVFSLFDKGTRLSAIEESLGTHHWMPGWAMGRRIDQITPKFDVFSLGKLLWALVSCSVLPLWYYPKPEYNLEQNFPDTPHIKLSNWLFSKCIVEEEPDCLSDAGELLKYVDQALAIIHAKADLIGPNVERRCKVCGLGTYRLYADRRDINGMDRFGLRRVSSTHFKIYVCERCGHVQLFQFEPNKNRDVWLDSTSLQRSTRSDRNSWIRCG